MNVKTMQDLYVLELMDLYSAEEQLTKALPKVVQMCDDEKLKKAIEEHLAITKEQLGRVQGIMKELGEDPKGHECKAMKGLIEEGQEVTKEVKDPKVCDAAIIAAAQRIEHYEIAGYGAAATFAELLGYKDHEKLLQKSLAEEKAADSLLTQLAMTKINDKAMTSDKASKAYVK